MRKLFGFLLNLFIAVVFLFVCSAAAMVFDGLNDQGDKADVALVVDAPVSAKDGSNPVLDRVVDMHRSEEINSVIVISSKWHENGQVENASAMAKYLEAHGIPADNIFPSDRGGTMQDTAKLAAEMVKAHRFVTVMIVADYYDVTRLKLALEHEGIKDVQKVHVGTVQKEDARAIVRSLVTLYEYVGKVYLLPEAEEVKKEAEVGMDKAHADAEKAKDKINTGLDNLPK